MPYPHGNMRFLVLPLLLLLPLLLPLLLLLPLRAG
jgi:hypothetical protein